MIFLGTCECSDGNKFFYLVKDVKTVEEAQEALLAVITLSDDEEVSWSEVDSLEALLLLLPFADGICELVIPEEVTSA